MTRLKRLCSRLGPGGTPRNSRWGVPPGSPNPDPISDQKNVRIFHTRFQTWRWSQNVTLHVYIKQKLCHHWRDQRLKRQQKYFLKSISNSHITLSFPSFGIETTNTLIHNCSSVVNHTRFQTKMGKVYIVPFSDQNGAKTLPFGAAHTYMAYIREYPPPPPPSH